MFQTIRNAFKNPDIRKRILYTLAMLVVIRLGSQLPCPGVASGVFANWFEQAGSSMDFFDAITGGSFLDMSIFALNITPYITSSIIMQLLTIAIPKLEEMHKDGEEGRKKIASITRYVTIALSLIESTAMAIGFGRSGYLTEFNALYVISCIATLTAGSAVLMWIGEQITDKGIGNGISIVLTINIISRIPQDLGSLWEQFVAGKTIPKATLSAIIILGIIILTIVLVILLSSGVRKIPVQYSRKMQGRTVAGTAKSELPMKVNTAGVIPVIFAQSILQTPVIIMQLTGKNGGTGFWGKVLAGMSQSNWCNPQQPILNIGLVIYILLIIAFAYFYTSITFNPMEIADNLKRGGGTIPGIREGKSTTEYLTRILNYVVFIGAIGLAIVSFIPIFFNGVFGASVSFGGTSLIIIVGVITETLAQVESQMRQRTYKSILDA